MNARMFHITTLQVWEQQKATGSYRHESLETEGFIHCSNEGQATPASSSSRSTSNG